MKYQTDTQVHTLSPIPSHFEPLLTAHLPHSLTLLRVLQYAKRPERIPPSARILFSFPSNSPHTSVSNSLTSPPKLGSHSPCNETGPFAIAFLSPVSYPETQLLIYSTLEDESHEANQKILASQREEAESCVLALFRTLRHHANELGLTPERLKTIIAGNIHSTVRELIARDSTGIGLMPRQDYEYQKWLFRVEKLPSLGTALPDGMVWAGAREEDYRVVTARTSIPRQIHSLKLMPSMFIKLEDGTPVAWVFLGTDGSLASLHCEVPYRGRGLAKLLASKMLREGIEEYGHDGWASAEVAPDNTQSQGVCTSLGGYRTWGVSWMSLDLTKIPENHKLSEYDGFIG